MTSFSSPSITKPAKLTNFHVVYRSGGTENFVWKASLAYPSRQEAEASAVANRKMGYPSMIASVYKVEKYGLPTTFDGEEW
jgi:hypothetical protein